MSGANNNNPTYRQTARGMGRGAVDVAQTVEHVDLTQGPGLRLTQTMEYVDLTHGPGLRLTQTMEYVDLTQGTTTNITQSVQVGAQPHSERPSRSTGAVNDDTCIVCYERPRTYGFAHVRDVEANNAAVSTMDTDGYRRAYVTHAVFCRRCAIRCYRTHQRCPLCNLPALRPVRPLE